MKRQSKKTDCQIRSLRDSEKDILSDFLYEAIFIPEGAEAPPRDIIEKPELQLYISDFGKKDDHCLVAEVDGRIVGAVWTRIMDDYGHMDDETPSLAISLYEEFRAMGIGTKLMEDILALLKENGYERVSLSVQKANYAYKLYRKVGFEVVEEKEEEFIMVKQL